MHKLKTAIIGFGVVGKRRRIFIEKNKNYKIVAISDVRFKRNFKKHGISFFKKYQEVSKLKLDCVFVTFGAK